VRKKKRAGFLAFDLDKDEVIVRERRTPPAFAALLNAQQMLDDAKAGILATGWQPGAAHALTINMLCDDGYTRVLLLPEPSEKKLAKFVRGLEDTFIHARVTRYLFMTYSDERLMIGAADAMGGMCYGYYEMCLTQMITWSRHSRRIDPIERSTYPFCHGDRGAMGHGRLHHAQTRRPL
jgi:hypothetical protein